MEKLREQIVMEIENAFSHVHLGNGIGINEANAIENYEDNEERQKARTLDEKVSWLKISDALVGKSDSALAFMDEEGFRFCIPVFMRYSLMHYDTCELGIIDSPIYALERFAKILTRKSSGKTFFTMEQNKVIAKYLKYVALDEGANFDSSFASRALDLFWRDYL